MNNQGFSLVEILVSTAIFSVVMITAAGALWTTIDANHKAQAIQSVMNNLNFALERSGDSKAVYYYLSGSQIVRGVNGEPLAITAPEIMIENLKFYVQGAGVGSQAQPRVTIVIRGYAGATAKIRTPFNLQTTLSQRMPK